MRKSESVDRGAGSLPAHPPVGRDKNRDHTYSSKRDRAKRFPPGSRAAALTILFRGRLGRR